jgi:uncharacterized SAM-binding protein YcdF (DUF218 family)
LFFALSKLFDVFLSPLTWGLVLVAAALPRRRPSRRSWRRRRALAASGIAVLFVFSTGYVSNALWWWLEHSSPSTFHDDPRDGPYDVVVLLGGVGDERVWAVTGEPALNDNVERLTATYRLLRDGQARYAIVSGGVAEPRLAAFNEASMLAGMLHDWGIEEDRVIIEDKAKNTRENAVFSAAIIRRRGFRRVLVVTSAFHGPRATECFRAVGLDADFLPVDYRAHPVILGDAAFLPRAESLFKSSDALREIFGKYIYRARGYGKR